MQRDLRRIITFSSLAYPHLNLEQVTKRVIRFDLRALEVRVSNDVIRLRPSDDPIRVARLLRDYNVSIVLLSSYVRTKDPDTSEGSAEIDLFNKISDLSNGLEISRIKILANYVDNINKSINIDNISRVALDEGLKILFEIHDYFTEISNLNI
jgi:sugar phosphate isomerase/epimerase